MAAAILFDGRASEGFSKSGSTYVNGTDIYQINQEVSRDAAISIVTDPLGVHGDVWKFSLTTADVLAGKARAELSAPNSGVNDVGPPRDNSDIYMAKGVDLWFFWRFMLAPDFVFSTNATQFSGDAVLLQMHDKPGSSTRVAPWHLILVNDLLEIRNSYHATTDNDRLLWRRTAQRGVWYSVVLNALWDDTAAPSVGYQNIWIDRRQVFKATGELNTYATDNSPGPWPKCSGLYYPHDVPSNFGGNTAYQAGLVVGTEYTTFDLFMAACGTSDTELEGFVVDGVGM